MAQIIPFRGIRYATDAVGDATNVVSPPYDRVDDELQSILYDRHPKNIVRIIKGRAEPGDGEAKNVYTRAAGYFHRWLDEGVLVRDEAPALYVYHQDYSFDGKRLIRKGFIALGKLEPEKVHAHERTLRGPKEDRLRLMRATEANFGHIFMLFNDPDRVADRALAAAVASVEPSITARDGDRNIHRVWRMTNRSAIERVQSALEDKDLYIADGHHRYETAVNYMHECRENGWRPAAPESFDVRMMTLFNVAEPGMSIRPIHRLIHGIPGYNPERFLSAADEHFVVRRHESFDDMAAATRAGRRAHTFGCATGGVYATFELRDEQTVDRLIDGRSADYCRLDVSILHAAVLERLLGIDAVALEEQQNVTYVVEPDRGRRAIENGSEQIFFYLNPTSAEEVVRVADHGEKMPQKSTDFYPKLLTGLVLSRMEIKK